MFHSTSTFENKKFLLADIVHMQISTLGSGTLIVKLMLWMRPREKEMLGVRSTGGGETEQVIAVDVLPSCGGRWLTLLSELKFQFSSQLLCPMQREFKGFYVRQYTITAVF